MSVAIPDASSQMNGKRYARAITAQQAQQPTGTQPIVSTTLPGWSKQTSGRSGASYAKWLAANPNFDPWSNLDAYAGAGASNDPIFRFAFAKTNDVGRTMGYGDGSQIPLAQRQQIFMANVERARQQWADLAQQQQQGDTGAAAGMQGVTWDTSAASRLPSEGWGYTPGWGLSHGGQSYETQGPGTTGGSGGGGNGGGNNGGGDTVADNPGGGGSYTGNPNITPGENAAYATNDRLRLQGLLDAMGIGTSRARHSITGSAAAKLAASLFDPWVQSQNVATPSMVPDFQTLFSKFAGYMNQGGGLGNIRTDALKAVQDLAGGVGGGVYDQEELAGLLEDFNKLRYTGSSDIYQRGQANRVGDVYNAYLHAISQGYGAPGTADDPQYLQFLQSNPLYSFMTGK